MSTTWEVIDKGDGIFTIEEDGKTIAVISFVAGPEVFGGDTLELFAKSLQMFQILEDVTSLYLSDDFNPRSWDVVYEKAEAIVSHISIED